MLLAQGGVCAICRRVPLRACLDHDHVTGRTRGVICQPCNLMLGGARDNPDTLHTGAIYLLDNGIAERASLLEALRYREALAVTGAPLSRQAESMPINSD